MKIFQFNYDNFEPNKEPIALCLGHFDSLHVGHQEIIREAKKLGIPVGLMTFDVSPAFVVGKKDDSCSLTSLADKADFLEQFGVDYLYVLHFDKDTSNLSRFEFVDKILKKLNIKNIYCGEDYRFGQNALGNPEYLKQFFTVDVVPLLLLDGKKVSSRDIVSLVKEGEVASASKLLGRNYMVSGNVVHGLHNGATIGFPTANIEMDYPYVIPKEGVYIGYGIINDQKYKAIICVGKHPTIRELNKPILEVHLLDFNGNLYGKFIYCQFVRYIRDIFTFESMEHLKAQLTKDSKLAKKELQ